MFATYVSVIVTSTSQDYKFLFNKVIFFLIGIENCLNKTSSINSGKIERNICATSEENFLQMSFRKVETKVTLVKLSPILCHRINTLWNIKICET